MNDRDAKSIVEKVKELVGKGNVSRVVVRRGDRELLNISVNAGIIGGAVALLAAKWALLAAVLATVGFGCKVEVLKDYGQVVDILSEETAQKARETAAGVVDSIKSTVRGAVDDFESVVSQDEEQETAPEEENEDKPED